MASDFLYAYIHEIAQSIPNWFTDNFDHYRFGPEPHQTREKNIKYLLKELLRKRRYVSADIWTTSLGQAIALVEPYLNSFEWLYQHLEDEQSQRILVKVLAYRALGHNKVKLPLNTPQFWASITQLSDLADTSDFIQVRFMDWKLVKMDLYKIGIPIKLYSRPKAVNSQFISEHYRCQCAAYEINVESGDIIIDAGGCYGDTALNFAFRSQPDGKVFSFEFVNEHLEIFKRNLDLNPSLKDRITIVDRAVWDQSGVNLTKLGEGPGTQVHDLAQVDMANSSLSLTIDDFVEIEKLPRVDFIKMDIEGAELNALRGSESTIKAFHPKLAISVYHQLTDFFRIPQFIDSIDVGYKFYLRHRTIHQEETVLFAAVTQV